MSEDKIDATTKSVITYMASAGEKDRILGRSTRCSSHTDPIHVITVFGRAYHMPLFSISTFQRCSDGD